MLGGGANYCACHRSVSLAPCTRVQNALLPTVKLPLRRFSLRKVLTACRPPCSEFWDVPRCALTAQVPRGFMIPVTLSGVLTLNSVPLAPGTIIGCPHIQEANSGSLPRLVGREVVEAFRHPLVGVRLYSMGALLWLIYTAGRWGSPDWSYLATSFVAALSSHFFRKLTLSQVPVERLLQVDSTFAVCIFVLLASQPLYSFPLLLVSAVFVLIVAQFAHL